VVDSFASSSLRLANVGQQDAYNGREAGWLTPDRLTAFLGGLALAGAPPFLSFLARLQIILDTAQALSIGWLAVLIVSLVLFSVAALRQFTIRRIGWRLSPASWTMTTVGCVIALALSVLLATEPLVASNWLGQLRAG
jgi:formate hydrogenlyase subunit 3/multisubunit Na+/H+ antiporter MnhD subunit